LEAETCRGNLLSTLKKTAYNALEHLLHIFRLIAIPIHQPIHIFLLFQTKNEASKVFNNISQTLSQQIVPEKEVK
jgi:hypothetical protein